MVPNRSPCVMCLASMAIPSPPTSGPPPVAFARYPSARAASCVCRSGLRRCLADSSDSGGRIEFVILRTGRVPPIALHPASRRRSYRRLQAGERMPGEDLHLSGHGTLTGARGRVFRPGVISPRGLPSASLPSTTLRAGRPGKTPGSTADRTRHSSRRRGRLATFADLHLGACQAMLGHAPSGSPLGK